jgi:hypothetical protein
MFQVLNFFYFLKISVPLDLLQYLELIPAHLKVEKNIALMQFLLTNSSFTSIDNSTTVKVYLIFQRRIVYHLINTYIPTITLLAIVEITLLFSNSKQDMAVTLSLTVLLVMYTFYQSISQTIPKTAYIKLIDFWLSFCLFVPFVIFVVESFWYLEQPKSFNKPEFNNLVGVQKKLDCGSQRKLVQTCVFASTFIFSVTYFTVALYFWACTTD